MIHHANPEIQAIIEMLAMERHHAAGWFAPHYNDSERLGRPRLSSMYYLLPGDETLAPHKLDGIAIWHFYSGAAAEMVVTDGNRVAQASLLGHDLASGQRPQLAVPAHVWQSCRSLGTWTLLGCTLSPGYAARGAVVLNAD